MKVSILMIAYNQERFISQAMDSILMQKVNFDYEIVIGEDCSRDNTRAILRRYQSEHPDRIKLILPNENLGMMKNLIQTLKACRGDYIALCEGDDYWTNPQKLQKQVDFLEANPIYSLLFCNVDVIYQDKKTKSHLGYDVEAKPANNERLQVLKIPEKTTTLKNLVFGNYIHTPGVIFRNWMLTDPVPKYLEAVSVGDWPLHLYSATKGDIFYMEEVLAAYRVHPSGAWSQKSRIQRLKLSILQYPPLLKSKIFDKDIERQLKRNTLSSFQRLVSEKAREDEPRDALKIALQVMAAWRAFPLVFFFDALHRRFLAACQKAASLSRRIG